MSSIEKIIERQSEIVTNDNIEPLQLPSFPRYTVCNLRGGIGKTSLVFNLSYETDDCLAVDTCPQGSLSYFYDEEYFRDDSSSIRDMILPYILPGFGSPSRIAKRISTTNEFFENKNAFFVKSSDDLFVLPSQITTTINSAKTVSGETQISAIDNLLFSLKNEIDRETEETGTKRCLIDTSPFFSGATHLALHASDALIVPVRTDQQSVNSFNLLLNILSNSSSEFRKNMPSNGHSPKIQLVILTHCTWSTKEGSRNRPNKQTNIFVEKVRDIVDRNIGHFTTDNPDNHILLLADFLGNGRISSALSKPISRLCNTFESSGKRESITINGERISINNTLSKISAELSYISKSIWQ
uniref:CobQ/CobB/MinD/ParA nucleotide binding domain-containing protein n=1 Tax=Candidatus Kentrum sp. TUN TaxID=2126343 RepID=A0A450ZIJ7_9GAMM|nr:MAG: CobQ/CobB/MinD/ParA nucleotide binding domain-containing protein [Candidatus Kentron sp. TUN]